MKMTNIKKYIDFRSLLKLLFNLIAFLCHIGKMFNFFNTSWMPKLEIAVVFLK